MPILARPFRFVALCAAALGTAAKIAGSRFVDESGLGTRSRLRAARNGPRKSFI